MKRLSRAFFARNALEVAPALLGRILGHESAEGLVTGRIVEVEAYRNTDDPGSHAHRGKTNRNATMFGPPGHLYVYLTYGIHHCANIVCERDGTAGAVLLRAVEPLDGLELMSKRRGLEDPRLLARGPGRLCQAFGLDRRHDGADLVDGPVYVIGRQDVKAPVRTSRRIGVPPTIGLEWRFYEEGPWASR